MHTNRIFRPDRIGLVGFHDRGFVIAAPAPPHDARLQEQVRRLDGFIGGTSTNIGDGLRVAVGLARTSPPSFTRRVWLLTDGYPNREPDQVLPAATLARECWVNVNTVGFGDSYDEVLLRRISTVTHRGQFIPVRTLRQLTAALTGGSRLSHRRHGPRPETTVLAIDFSGSMTEPMAGRRKIEVVQEAVLHLLRYKQVLFA